MKLKSTHMNAEHWLRGPVENIPLLLQPVAHALLQAKDEIFDAMSDFPGEKLWLKPSGVASVGFHLQHLTGVIDRLFTYARGEQLTSLQSTYLSAEGVEDIGITPEQLLEAFANQVEAALQQLAQTDPASLTEARGVGRKQTPSTVIGILFHAAEHTMRHTGQLLVTIKWARQ